MDLEGDLEVSVFAAAAQSFRWDTLLRPFPPTHVRTEAGVAEKCRDELLETLARLPPMRDSAGLGAGLRVPMPASTHALACLAHSSATPALLPMDSWIPRLHDSTTPQLSFPHPRQHSCLTRSRRIPRERVAAVDPTQEVPQLARDPHRRRAAAGSRAGRAQGAPQAHARVCHLALIGLRGGF
eukprot:m.19407 g.19407  ORF g.19407 m.19407 type:complete len:183 (+) comp3436_c0_seq2:3-551(+)